MKTLFSAARFWVLAISGALGVRAQIVAWDINGVNAAATNPFAATTLGANLASANLALGAGVAASNAASTFGASSFNQTSFAAAIAGDDYVSIQLTPLSGHSLSLSSLTALFGVSTAVTNFNIALTSSATGFATSDLLWTFSFNSTLPAAQTISLAGISALQALTSTVEFRFYGWRDPSGTTTFRFRNNTGNDIAISGSVGSAIPEPATYAALFGAVGLIVAMMFKRQPFGLRRLFCRSPLAGDEQDRTGFVACKQAPTP